MIDAITGLFRYCALARRKARGQNLELRMIHFVLHDANDGVAVVVVEGVKAEMQKDLAKKVKTLETLMRSSVANDPRYRVRRKPDGHDR